MIVVASKKKSVEKLKVEYPGAYILDVTSSSSSLSCRKLSPFYPHKNIPIPGASNGMTSCSVEGIWQGLKVFENSGIDLSSFRNDTMKEIKRTIRKYGKPIGHQFGVYSDEILNYIDAKRLIYAPSYRYVLENVPDVVNIIKRIKKQSEKSIIILLDYNINPDNRDSTKPLSHAELIKMYIEGHYPTKEEDFLPAPKDVSLALKLRAKQRTYVSEIELKEYQGVIVEYLYNDKLSIVKLKNILHIEVNSNVFKLFLESIPNIRIEKTKRTIYYTLMGTNKEISLF